MKFHRRLLGYSRAAVDGYVDRQEAALSRFAEEHARDSHQIAELETACRALDAQVRRLEAATPMLNVSQEISELLQSFATNVATMREQAERDATATRAAADAYAEQRAAEAERRSTEHEARARATAEDTLRVAREEVRALVQVRDSFAKGLKEVAGIVLGSLQTLEGIPNPSPPSEGLPQSQPDTPAKQQRDISEAGAPDVPAYPSPEVPTSPGAGRDEGTAVALPEPVEVDPERGVVVDFRPIPPPERPDA